jgi:hypothetical protein
MVIFNGDLIRKTGCWCQPSQISYHKWVETCPQNVGSCRFTIGLPTLSDSSLFINHNEWLQYIPLLTLGDTSTTCRVMGFMGYPGSRGSFLRSPAAPTFKSYSWKITAGRQGMLKIVRFYAAIWFPKSSIQSWWNRQKPCSRWVNNTSQCTAAMCPRLLTSLVQRPCHQLILIRFCTPIFFSATQYEFLWISDCIDSKKSNGVVFILSYILIYTPLVASYSHEHLIFPLCMNGYNWL